METLIYTLTTIYVIGAVLAFGRINAIRNSRFYYLDTTPLIILTLSSWIGFVAGWMHYNDNPYASKFLDYGIGTKRSN